MSELFPRVQVLLCDIPAQATAGTVQTTVLGEAEFVGVVSRVALVPNAGVTFNATNYRTFECRNEGLAGAGIAKVCDPATANNGTSAVSLVAQDARELTITAVSADKAVVVGDVVSLVEAVAGTGVAHGGFHCLVELTRS